MNQRLAEYAAAYAGIGLIPIPLRRNGKIPAFAEWQRSPPMKAGDARAAFHPQPGAALVACVAEIKAGLSGQRGRR